MARVTKEADVRRDELLDVALDLCRDVGFESMSVEQVTTAAGVAKGTFYHYFVSKQDLLLQLVARFGDDLFAYLEAEMHHVDGDAPQRLRELLRLSSQWKVARVDSTMAYLPFLYKEENYTLRHKLFSAWLDRIRPLLLDIIEQGAREGTFTVTDPDASTDIMLSVWFDYTNRLYTRAMAHPDAEGYVATMLAGVSAMFEAQERVLGAPVGSLQTIVDPQTIDIMTARLAELYGSMREEAGYEG